MLLPSRHPCPTSSIHVLRFAVAAVYTVRICTGPHCTCPDFEKGNLCKHILFVMMRVLRLGHDNPLIWQAGGAVWRPRDIHMCLYIYIYICVCVCVCVYMYIHSYTYTYTQKLVGSHGSSRPGRAALGLDPRCTRSEPPPLP